MTWSVMRPGTGNGPAFQLDRLDGGDLLDLPLPIGFVPVPQAARERRRDVAVGAVGVVVEAHLQGNHALLAQVHALDDFALVPVPEVDLAAIAPRGHVVEAEAGHEGLGRAPTRC
jgi:hypothetical protein